MKTIGIDQSLFAKSSFEHRCMNTIKKIYQHAGKCDDQQNLKDIIDSAVILTLKVVIDNIPNAPMTSTPVNEPSVSKSLCLFTNILDAKPKTENRRIVAEKSKLRSIKVGNNQWTKKSK